MSILKNILKLTYIDIITIAAAVLLYSTAVTTAEAVDLTGYPGAVALDERQNLEAFVTAADGSLARIVQGPGGVGGWQLWERLTGLTLLGGRGLIVGVHPVAGVAQGGRLDVFTVTTDRTLWHRLQQTDGSFSAPWQALPGSKLASLPAVATNSDGRLEVFALDSTGTLVHIYQRWAGAFGAWSGWDVMSGSGFTGSVAAAMNNAGPLAGRLEVFLSSEDSVYHTYQAVPNGGPWTGLMRLPVSTSNFVFDAQITVARNADGCLEVVALSNVGEISDYTHAWQTTCGTMSWAPFSSLDAFLGRQFAYLVSPIAIANLQGSGWLEIFASGTDGAIYHNWQVTTPGAGSAPYSGWDALGKPGGAAWAGAAFVGANANGGRPGSSAMAQLATSPGQRMEWVD
jgi:hypothetical protein